MVCFLSIQKGESFVHSMGNGGCAGLLHILYFTVAPGDTNGRHAVSLCADHIIGGIAHHDSIVRAPGFFQKIRDNICLFTAAAV